jgi:hypothetical protein
MHKITDENEANIEDIHEQHYSPAVLSLYLSDFAEQIFQKRSRQVEGLKRQKTSEETSKTESNRISYSFQDALEQLRKDFLKGTQYDFESLAQDVGLSPEDAGKLFWQLVERGELGRDPEGWWRWVT